MEVDDAGAAIRVLRFALGVVLAVVGLAVGAAVGAALMAQWLFS